MANVSASRPEVHAGVADDWPAWTDRDQWELGPEPEESTDHGRSEPTDDEGYRRLLADDSGAGYHTTEPSPEERARLTLDELMDRRAEDSALLASYERGHLLPDRLAMLAEGAAIVFGWAWMMNLALALTPIR